MTADYGTGTREALPRGLFRARAGPVSVLKNPQFSGKKRVVKILKLRPQRAAKRPSQTSRVAERAVPIHPTVFPTLLGGLGPP